MADVELIVVSGPLAGQRFAVAEGCVEIGRAPESTIRLEIPEVAWRHCSISYEQGRHQLIDRRTGHGTYVNGMRAERHWLEDGDQVSIGETVMLFRTGASALELPASTQSVLLKTCSLTFLMRALASASGDEQRTLLEAHAARLLADLMAAQEATVVVGRPGDLAMPKSLAPMMARLTAEGPVADKERSAVAAPLYVRGEIAGFLAVSFAESMDQSAGGRLEEHRDTLAAIATLVSAALESAQEVERLRLANALLTEEVSAGSVVVGTSPLMRKLMDMVHKVAPLDTSVLLLGESGTGKEVIARTLHQSSARCAAPFVAINCAAITDTLLESELFGHEKGSFTGAVALKKGKLEMAEGGTMFLDEIGELAMPLQAKLLRVLQQREYERVGGTRTLRMDVRLIAATNRDLAVEARRGAFREDLYHRLNVIALRTPPLRERKEDILELALFFLQRASARCRRRVSAISPEAARCLQRYDWPGNVRELENAIERAVVLGDGETLLPEDLPDTLLDVVPAVASAAAGGFQDAVVDAKRDAILRVWAEAHGDYKDAARRLGVHPNSLLRMIRTLGLRDQLQG